MGAKYWNFNVDSSQIERVGVTTEQPSGSVKDVGIVCQNNTCHVVSMYQSFIVK